MDIALPTPESGATTGVSKVEIPQYGRWAILAIWAAAALPMAELSWLVAPVVAGRLAGEANVPLVKALTASMTAGLVWQSYWWSSSSLASRGRCAGRWSATPCGCGPRAAPVPAGSAGCCGCC
jgi:hypothetical protein